MVQSLGQNLIQGVNHKGTLSRATHSGDTDKEAEGKTSLYFLQRPQRPLVSQFYITRLDTEHGSRALVVFLKPEAWALIDGETLFTHLAELARVWPQSAKVQVGLVWLVVADYQVWKDKVHRKQMQGGSE